MHTLVYLLLCGLLVPLLGCTLADDDATATPNATTTTPPFAGPASSVVGSGGVASPALTGTTQPLPTTCPNQEAGNFRCNGTTVQFCTARNTWDNYQFCADLGQRCSTAHEDCSGFANIACCVP